MKELFPLKVYPFALSDLPKVHMNRNVWIGAVWSGHTLCTYTSKLKNELNIPRLDCTCSSIAWACAVGTYLKTGSLSPDVLRDICLKH